MFMRLRFAFLLGVAVLFAGSAKISRADRDVLTFHYDNQRTGWNSLETTLRPDNVSSSTFGKLWYAQLDGQVYGAPLVLTGVNINDQVRNATYAATENNTVYALDSDTGEVLWKNHVASSLNQAQFESALGGGCPNVNPTHGITGTPVIDASTHTLYVTALTQVSGKQVYQVFAMDALTGKTLDGWPVTIQGSYKGSTFTASQLTQRTAMTLYNGAVYMEFSSRCDIGEWHGWITGIPIQAPHTPILFNVCPTSYGGGLWGSAGASLDVDGHFYVVTGNGGFDLKTGGDNGAQSILRLTPDAGNLDFSKKTEDYFTPTNYDYLNGTDQDLGGSSAITLPDHVGSKTPHLVLTGGKNGTVYLVNRDNLGGIGGQLDQKNIFSSGNNAALITTTPSTYADADGNLFVYVTTSRYGQQSTDPIKGLAAYKITIDPASSESRLTYVWTNPTRMLFAGTSVVSSDGGKNGIVWVTDANKSVQHTDTARGSEILYALDAETGEQLYSSNDNKTRDDPGDGRKFSAPTVANGKVYTTAGGIGTPKTYGVAAFGLLPLQGDVNLDGTVDIRDATLALQAAVGLKTLTGLQAKMADFNSDGTTDIRDVTLILRKSLGL
jgi:outer membrane protein assembly factor BamB